jgi:WD40 repeat protein/tRNA A-37 threonylcarbamoyl transferase component Bud32
MRRSGVVEEKRLDAYLDQQGPFNRPEAPHDLADAMVRDGLLTEFQADQLLQGRCRRFTIANKYKLLERLGAGGMGSVYLCEHQFLRRRVAVKVLPAGRADDRSALDRFYREARAVAALDHPNIVRAYDIDRDDQLHFLVMEYIDGSSLQEIIKKHGPMDVLRACHYIRQAAEGLQHAHEAGWVHRDIKPGNLILDRTGTLKVLDLGLARFFYEDDSITKEHDETVLGTTDYLAPEQAIDGNVDIRADVYSLGATFYFLLTAKTPFSDGSTAQKLIWHQTRQPKPIRSARPEVPEELAAVIHKMMAKDLTERYQTPADVVAVLTPWVQTPIPLPPEHEMPRLSPAALAVGASDGAGATAGAGARAGRIGPYTPGVRARSLTPQVIRAADPACVIRGTPRPGPAVSADSTPGTNVFDRNFPGTPVPVPDSGLPMSDSRVVGPAFADTDEPSARIDTKEVGTRKEGDVVVVEQEVRSFGGHRQALPRLAFSPDDRLALTGSMRTTVPLWDVETGRVIRRFAGHTDAVYAVAFARDGLTAATGSFDRTVRVWDMGTGKEVQRIQGHEKGVWALAFLPDGGRIVSAGEDQVARLWDANTAEIIRRFKGHAGAIHNVAVSPEGRRLLTASRDSTARVWDVETGKPIQTFTGHGGSVYCVAVSPDGTLAASGSKDRSVRLWEVATGTPVRSFEGHADQVTCVAFSADGRRLVSSSFDTTFRVWDIATGKELFRFVGHRGPIVSLALSHDGTSILSGSMDQTIRLWKVPS